MLQLIILLPLCLAVSQTATLCERSGPEYWCSSCDNAKECAHEVEELLVFCQNDMKKLLNCEIPISYIGFAEGATPPTEPRPSFKYHTPGYFQFDEGDDLFGEDALKFIDDDMGYYYSDIPSFDKDLLKELEDSTAASWGYMLGEALETTQPAVTERMDPTIPTSTLAYYNPQVKPPTITRSLYNISAFAGQATVISCTAESVVELGISITKLEREPKRGWLKKNSKNFVKSKDSGSEYDRKSITAFLNIDHLDEVDSGWYVCMAINEGGRTRSLMYLSVTDLCKGVTCEGHQSCIPNYITKETTCHCPECQNDLELVCGSNCKTYQNECWLAKDNCELGTNHSMMIHAPCPRVIPPMFTVEPSDMEVEEGHHLVLECHALSFPIATYDWYKVGEEGQDVHIATGSQYLVEETTYNDEGEYYCVASICEAGHSIKSRVAKVYFWEHSLKTRTEEVKDKVCRVFGDPHITTFDGSNFNLPGLCSYILSMDCNLAEWSVYGKFQNCSGTGNQGSCLESVTIVYRTNIIELQRGWAINYRGEKIDFFETQQHEVEYFHFDLDENLNLNVKMENGVQVVWDGLYNVQIKLSTDDNPMLCGICGNADGDKNNEFISSSAYYYNENKQSQTDVAEFGDSWKIDPYGVCEDWKQLEHVDSCTEAELDEAEHRCQEMFNHPVIQSCHHIENIDLQYYIRSCAADRCTMARWEEDFDPTCGILSAYTSACRLMDVYINDDDWREDTGCGDLKTHQKFVISTGCPKRTILTRH